MRLTPSDPDIETIVSRILKGDYDLQPDFQRGEVWGDGKKRRLIDTVLREWHVPPIHLIELDPSSKQVVLDGQQRLVAIRDFVQNELTVDGLIEPINPEIKALDGLTFAQLPETVRRRFLNFNIRVFRISDYESQEPAELFYRLNQPTNLTAAEQRNAFFGEARKQIKALVSSFEASGLDKNFIGFSNSRMAYDDVAARLCFSLEQGTIAKKITATALADRYREGHAFSDEVYNSAEVAIGVLGECRKIIKSDLKEFQKYKFNKATLYSWLWFFDKIKGYSDIPNSVDVLAKFICYFATLHSQLQLVTERTQLGFDDAIPPDRKEFAFILQIIAIYNDRSSSRVADISSVLWRDIAIWTVFELFLFRRLKLPPSNRRLCAIRKASETCGADRMLDVYFHILADREGWEVAI